jgi:hypothetical protein
VKITKVETRSWGCPSKRASERLSRSSSRREELAPVMNCNRPHEYCGKIYMLSAGLVLRFEYLAARLFMHYFCLFSATKERHKRPSVIASRQRYPKTGKSPQKAKTFNWFSTKRRFF